MADTFMKKVQGHRADIRSIAVELSELGLSFEETGNTIVAGKLYSAADYLRKAEEGIDKAISDDLNKQLEGSVRAHNALMESVSKKE